MYKDKKITNLSKENLNLWIKENPDKRFDLSNVTFINKDFTGWRFSKAVLNNSRFINCNFFEADLSEISAINVDFTGSKFIKSALYRANLSRSKCINVDFENAWMYRCIFSDAVIENCNFHLAKIQKVRWPKDFFNKITI